MSKEKKNVLFSDAVDSDIEKEWVDMPEFVQNERKAYQEIIVRFSCEKDVKKFAKKIGRNITPKTKYLWFPKLGFQGHSIHRKYIDES